MDIIIPHATILGKTSLNSCIEKETEKVFGKFSSERDLPLIFSEEFLHNASDIMTLTNNSTIFPVTMRDFNPIRTPYTALFEYFYQEIASQSEFIWKTLSPVAVIERYLNYYSSPDNEQSKIYIRKEYFMLCFKLSIETEVHKLTDIHSIFSQIKVFQFPDYIDCFFSKIMYLLFRNHLFVRDGSFNIRDIVQDKKTREIFLMAIL